MNVLVTNDELLNKENLETVVEFKHMDKCWMCYDLVETNPLLQSDNECCARYSIDG